jgi:WD40 repeat protein
LAISWKPDSSNVASSSADGTVKIWDPVTRDCIQTLEHAGEVVRGLSYSPDGEFLATSTDHVRIFKTSDWSLLYTVPGSTVSVRSVSWIPRLDVARALLAIGCGDKHIYIWDNSARNIMHSMDGHENAVVCVAWSADGSELASACHDGVVKVWSVSVLAWECRLTLPGNKTMPVSSVAWSPDGTTLVTVGVDPHVKLWDMEYGHLKRQLGGVIKGHTDWIRSVEYSPNGQMLATASNDKTVILWDLSPKLESKEMRRVFSGHHDKVRAVAWSPDGKILASGSNDRSLRIWMDRDDVLIVDDWDL